MRFVYALIFGIVLTAFCLGTYKFTENSWVLALPLIGMISGFILQARQVEGGQMILWGSAMCIGLFIVCLIIVAHTIQC